MKNHPLVSIVIPSFNQGRYIEQTILSVLNQDYPAIELIVVDGGSKDESVEIIRKFDGQISYWVSEHDKGQADAINKGWRHATGEYIGWINSDDMLLPNSISLAVNFMKANENIGFVYGDLEIVDEFGCVIRKRRYEQFNLVNMVENAGYISQPGNLFRKGVYENIGELDINLHFQMDLDYWIRAALVADVGYIPVVLAKFRRHTQSKTNNLSNIAANDILYIYKKLYSRKDIPKELLDSKKKAWGNAFLYSSICMYGADCYSESLKRLLTGFKYYPMLVFSKMTIMHILKLTFMFLVGGRKTKLTNWIIGKL